MTRGDRGRAAVLLVVAGLVAHAPLAAAQSAEAEALFREGRRLLKAGELEAGCAKLEASATIEASVGTLLNLGDCRERLGKLASAWAAFEKADALARRAGNDDKRQAEARRRAGLLEPRLSVLTIAIAHPVEGLVVRRDALVIEAGAWNTAVPVDAGVYTVSAEAPGHQAWRSEIHVLDAARRVVTVPALTPLAPAAPAPAPVTSPRSPPPPPARTAHAAPARTWTGARALAVGMGVLGAGSVGAGIYFGVRSHDLADRADVRCPLVACSDPESLRLNDRARVSATRANIFYAAGGAALAASLVLWLVGGPDTDTVVTPVGGARSGGISVATRF